MNRRSSNITRISWSIARTIVLASLGVLVACGAQPALVAAPAPRSQATSTEIAVVAAAATATPQSPPSPATQGQTPPVTAALAQISPTPSATTDVTATIPLGATPEPIPTLSLDARQRLFDEVWSIIDENYLYDDFHGVDWQAVRQEFAPQVATVQSDQELYTLLSTMVSRLGDQHSRFLGPSAANKEDVLSSGREEQVGIGVLTMFTTDAILIQHVFPDSPAARAGLLPRDRIVAIDGDLYAHGDLQGPEGSQVRLTVVRPGGESRDVVLTRQKVEGLITPTVQRLENDIGYLSVTTMWVSDMADQVGTALTELTAERPLKGLIIDLRSNPGGWRSVLTGILGHFVQGDVGHFVSRRDAVPLMISETAGPDLRGVPLVVLVDKNTASYAELVAAILQSEAGATVVGVPSAGNTETIYAYELTGDSRLWVAQEGFQLRSNSNLEGVGVQPDIAVAVDWTRYSEREDPGILAGLQVIQAVETAAVK